MVIINILKRHLPIIIFVSVYILISLLIYKDFGITQDEYVEREASNDLIRYIFKPTSTESIIDDDYTDTVYEKGGFHPLISQYQRSYQLVQNLLNPKEYYEWDHLINMLFGTLFFVLTYLIFYSQYKSALKSMVGVIFIALIPRLIGDIPTNNKDIPFAIMYLSSMYAILILNKGKTNTYIRVLILGIIFGITQTFRAVGFSIYIVYFIWFLVNSYHSKSLNKKSIFNFILELIVIGFVSLTTSVAIFPWLGANLIMNLKEFLLDSQNFQKWDNYILFNGEYLTKDQRPWYYLFTWLLITTPVFIIGLFTYGLIKVKKYLKNNIYTIAMIGIVVNLAIYLILQPVIYNGLRHFLFLLPMIAIISAVVFIDLYTRSKGKYRFILILLVLLNSSLVIINYIKIHPYQYIYFNELIGGLKGASGKFELDYWGASYKEASEWLANKEDINESDYILTCENYLSVLYYSKYKFGMLSGHNLPKYGICEFDSENYSPIEVSLDRLDVTKKMIYEVKRNGAVINTVWQFYYQDP